MNPDDFIIYLDKFEYDVEETECEPFIPLKGLYLKMLKKIFLINFWIFIPLLVYMWGVEGVTVRKILYNLLYWDHEILIENVSDKLNMW